MAERDETRDVLVEPEIVSSLAVGFVWRLAKWTLQSCPSYGAEKLGLLRMVPHPDLLAAERELDGARVRIGMLETQRDRAISRAEAAEAREVATEKLLAELLGVVTRLGKPGGVAAYWLLSSDEYKNARTHLESVGKGGE